MNLFATRVPIAVPALIAFALTAVSRDETRAQQRATVLPDTVVSATRVETPVSQVASTVRVITAADIARNQHRSIADALAKLPGLNVVQQGGPGKLTSVFTRGSNGNHTLVLVDGIEINDPSTTDGRVDFAHIMLEDIDRIEVLYGSQGTLYGSDAIGAVINITTKKGTDKPSLTALLEGGSFETANQFATLRGGGSRYHYSANVQHLYTGGLSATPQRLAPPGRTNDDDSFENVTASAKFGGSPIEILDLIGIVRYVRTDNETDASLSLPQSDDDSNSKFEQTLLRGEGRLALFDGKLESKLATSYTRYDRRDATDPDPANPADFLRDDNIGTKLKHELQNDLRAIDNHVLTLGAETEKDTIDSRLASTSAFGPFNQSAGASARNNAVYFQDQASYLDRFFGTIGGRVDDHERFGDQFTWRVAPAYLHTETDTKIRGSYSTGFKAPTLFQLFGSSISLFGAFNGNPKLLPEESKTWEVGLDQSLLDGRYSLAFTYFETVIKNLIQFTPDFSSNQNLGKVDTKGLEFTAVGRPTADVNVSGNYSFTTAIDRETGEALRRRPMHKASAEIAVRPMAEMTVAATGVFVGRRPDTDAISGARIVSPSYFIANISAGYDLTRNFQLLGRVENLFDRDYEDPDGFARPGVGVFVGIKATY
jgi:vitamin B12 transporter